MILPRLFEDLSGEHRHIIPAGAPWLALRKLENYITSLLAQYKPGIHSPLPPGAETGKDVYIGPGCTIEPGVYIKGPAWIGPGCVLRNGFYCRENVLVEGDAMLGHACEIKNSYLMKGAQVPHFNYVGDSILGAGAHLGAGVILANIRLDKKTIILKNVAAVGGAGSIIDTTLEKFGAIIGDNCEIGCNSVLNPGSIIGAGAVIYPLSVWKGIMAEDTVYKGRLPQGS